MFARLLYFFVLVLAAPAFADESTVPKAIEGGRVVTVEEAKVWFDSGKALFVDVRNPLNYGRGHIPLAVAAPFDDKREDDGHKQAFLRELPGDRRAPIVIYSHGDTGWKSYHAAAVAIKAGYGKIMWMREGFKI
jgi:rhodanese-related sulfurtransferase